MSIAALIVVVVVKGKFVAERVLDVSLTLLQYDAVLL